MIDFVQQVLPKYLSDWTSDKVRAEGVRVMPSVRVNDAYIAGDGKLKMMLSDGSEVDVDHAVVAVGIQPNTDLAESSRLEVDDKLSGFKVNAELEAR